jgi:nucleotide-binding universal stress UspA family protein
MQIKAGKNAGASFSSDDRENALAIRKILLHVPTFPDAPAQLELEGAAFFAQCMGASVTAAIAQLNPDPQVWPEGFGSWIVDVPRLMNEAAERSALAADHMKDAIGKVAVEYGVPIAIRTQLLPLYPSPQPLVDLARVHDILVLPFPESNDFDHDFVRPAIFETGRPSLLVPHGRGKKPLRRLDTVVVAWDFSREAARALSDALPVLLQARSTKILTVFGEKGLETTATMEDLKSFLGGHGVNYTLERAVLKDGAIGKLLAESADALHADLLVMGAYGHSRLREFVLGGATRGLIADPPLPLFLSH